MKLLLTIEAEHEESQVGPITVAVAEFSGKIQRMGFSAPEINIDLDYHDEGDGGGHNMSSPAASCPECVLGEGPRTTPPH